MRSIFVKAMIILLFASFVLPAGYELSSQQEPKGNNSQVQKKDGTGKKKHKKNKKKKNKKKHNKKIKKNKKNRIGGVK